MKTPGQTINEMPTGTFTTLSKVAPIGSLQARRDKTGTVSLFWRYSIGTKSERVTIGIYDSAAPPRSLTPTVKGYSVAAAIRSAEALAVEHHQHRAEGGRPALLALEKAQGQAEADMAARASLFTLKNLLTDYVDHQRVLGKVSSKDAQNIFQNHVFKPWPDLAALPACDITDEQFADMMRRLVELGKGRTANKLRTYAAAAYALAKAARTNPAVPVRFKGYGIRLNPAADTSPDRASNRADKNPLSTTEMQTYWRNVKAMGGFEGAVLTLHLLTGGQRIDQFLRLQTADVMPDTITLFDGKGRPGAGLRTVVLPLTAPAAAAIAQISPIGKYAISLTAGETHIWDTALTKWAKRAATGIDGFTPKRIRSGVETLLAKLGIPEGIRGRLQSHGISGVQNRHYDGHDYLNEKRQALGALLAALVDEGFSNVVPLHKAA
jgi:integrase